MSPNGWKLSNHFVIHKQLEELVIWQSWRPEFEPAKWHRSSPTSVSWAMQVGSKSGMLSAAKNQLFRLLVYMRKEWLTETSEETIQVGIQIGKSLKPGNVLCFFGDLGSGKTTLIKGIIHGVTGLSPDEVTSPTFVYMTPYRSLYAPEELVVFHFDLYRLKNSDEFLFMGFEEYLHSEGICCIEWSERIASVIPKHADSLHMVHVEQQKRRICYDKISL